MEASPSSVSIQLGIYMLLHLGCLHVTVYVVE